METAKDLRGAKSCRGTVRNVVSLDIPKKKPGAGPGQVKNISIEFDIFDTCGFIMEPTKQWMLRQFLQLI